LTSALKQKALSLLRQALNNSTAEFRAGQWEAIEVLLSQQERLLGLGAPAGVKVLSIFGFTTVAALLRQGGSGEVFPLALVLNSLGEE
jgi:ATP-dependent DNA helicase RecQ